MVEDLLRGFVAGPQADDIDFSTLEKLSAEYVSDELLKRHGDAAWRVRLRERWLHLVVLLEFQSRTSRGWPCAGPGAVSAGATVPRG